MTSCAGDDSVVCQLSSQPQQQQQQQVTGENHVIGNCEGNTVQEPQNKMAAEVDSQTEMEKPGNGVLLPCNVTSMYAF